MIEIKAIPPKEFRKRYGNVIGGACDDVGDDFIVTIPKGARPIVKLHELGHATLGHKEGNITLEELLHREIAAELFAYKHMGRKIGWTVAIPGIMVVAEDHSWRHPNYLRRSVIKAFEKEGHPLSVDEKRKLWSYLRQYLAMLKEQDRIG